MNILGSIKAELDHHQLFRRLVVVGAGALIAYTTAKSFEYAFDSSLSGLDIAAVITAIQLPVTGLMTFVSKLYWDGKDNATNNNN